MAAIHWTPALAVGIPELDAQHQELFQRVDRLLDAMLANDRSEAARLLAFMKEYVVTHFAAEEKLMREHGYPGYAIHKREHDAFIEALRPLEEEYAAHGATAGFVIQMNRQVCDWLRDHVYLTDTALGRYVRGIREK